MSAWKRAGVLVGLLQILFTLPALSTYFIPYRTSMVISLIATLLFLPLYPLAGLLAAWWTKPLRSLTEGARVGALAGLLAGAIDGAFTLVVGSIAALTGAAQRTAEEALATTPDAALPSALSDVLFSAPVQIAITFLGALFHVGFTIVWSVAAALIYAAVRRQE